MTINGRFLSQAITGVQRYAHEMLTALDGLLSAGAIERLPVTVLTPPGAIPVPDWVSLRVQPVGRSTGHMWEQMELPQHARGTLLFTPCGGAPILHRDHVITIHDAGPFTTPEAYQPGYRTYYKGLQRMLGRRARHVITVSDFSRRELIEHLKIPCSRITRTWLSGEHVLRYARKPDTLLKHGLSHSPYILAVGSSNPNKNLRRLAEAVEQITNRDVLLAIAGGSNAAIFGDAGIAATRVKQLGFVGDSELRTLYENAACFIFPSTYEGFGMPPLEALMLECPVVASRAASMPEVLGEAVTYCDPYSPADMAAQIDRVLAGDHPDRNAAREHASRYSWERCARETWDILLGAVRS